jgi:hypothetical protein
MQGKSNLNFSNDIKLTKNVSIGYLGSYNLTKDNWANKLLVENQFYTKIGPEDFKLKIAYDTVRKRSILGLDLLVGNGKTAVDFDKLKMIKTGEDTQSAKKQKNTKI